MRFLPSSCFPNNQAVAFPRVAAHKAEEVVHYCICDLKTVWDKFIHGSIPDLAIE